MMDIKEAKKTVTSTTTTVGGVSKELPQGSSLTASQGKQNVAAAAVNYISYTDSEKAVLQKSPSKKSVVSGSTVATTEPRKGSD